MEVRMLRPEERFDAALISTIAFHGKVDDLQKLKDESMKETVEDWGAFSEDGKLMARILNYRYTVRLNGSEVPCGGIGGVSTLPEYRETGAIRSIFRQLLTQARKNGEVLSALYPFNHAFYRKFGYETVCKENVYAFAPDTLSGYHFSGKAVMYAPGADIRPYTELYARFASIFNLSMVRTDAMMQKHLGANCYQDRSFSYLLSEEEPVAFVTFQDIRKDEGAVLKVTDLAWLGRTGFTAVLGFLSRFTADYARIELVLPSELELLSVIRSRNAYGIEKSTAQGYMVRAVHVPELLRRIAGPGDEAFTIRVTDEIIPENNGTWRVQGNQAEPVQDRPDLSVSERALGQMAAGAVSLQEAMLRPDVDVFGNEEALRRIFVRKPLWVAEHF